MKSKLLPEVLADVKALRAVAYVNAKKVLEEAFAPKVTEMLTKKIKEEMEEEGSSVEDEDKLEEGADQDDSDYQKKPKGHSTKKEFSDEVKPTVVEGEDQDNSDYKTDAPKKSKETWHERDAEFKDGVKTVKVEGQCEEEEEGMSHDSIDEILKELESESNEEGSAPEDLSGEEHSPEGDDTEIVIDTDEDGSHGNEESEQHTEVADEADGKNDLENENDEHIDLEEILSEFSNEDEEEESKERVAHLDEVKKLRNENTTLKSCISEMKSQINQVNLLNSRLLYVSKLFTEHSLNNTQKEKIVEAFDSTDSIKEIKLAYRVLSESLKNSAIKSSKLNRSKQTIAEGIASKPISSTRSVLTESTEDTIVANRLQKLAGIKLK